MKELLEDLRKEWRPSDSEAADVRRIAAALVSKLAGSLKRARMSARPVVGGSGAKGTWLRGMHDIDVFVCFDYKKYKEESDSLSEFLAAAMKKAFPKYERLHGSRDYFRTKMGGYNFEVVPILGIRKASQALNITDVSLLHSGWVNKKISKNKAVADETRLAKAFCRAQRVYGAESYVRGFSGYACEVLTAYYGSFLQLISAAAKKWKKQIAAGKKIIIDAERHYKGKDPLREMNEAKVQSSLVVIDPVQQDRNVTAALSNEALQKFIGAANAFMKRPGVEYFERQPITPEALAERAKAKNLAIISAAPTRGKEDVIGAKLVKAHEHILKQLAKNGFEVAEAGWDWNKKGHALFWYIAEKKAPAAEIRYGPPLSNKEHAGNFRKEHSGKKGRRLFEKDGRLYASIEREFTQPLQMIRNLIGQDPYLKDKAASYSIVEGK